MDQKEFLISLNPLPDNRVRFCTYNQSRCSLETGKVCGILRLRLIIHLTPPDQSTPSPHKSRTIIMEPHKAAEPLLDKWRYHPEKKPEALATKPTVNDDDSDDGSDDLDGSSNPLVQPTEIQAQIISNHFPLQIY